MTCPLEPDIACGIMRRKRPSPNAARSLQPCRSQHAAASIQTSSTRLSRGNCAGVSGGSQCIGLCGGRQPPGIAGALRTHPGGPGSLQACWGRPAPRPRATPAHLAGMPSRCQLASVVTESSSNLGSPLILGLLLCFMLPVLPFLPPAPCACHRLFTADFGMHLREGRCVRRCCPKRETWRLMRTLPPQWTAGR